MAKKRSPRCPRGTVPQSILFPKRKYTKGAARKWLKEHGLKSRIAAEPRGSRSQYWHAPQADPKRYKTVGTIPFGKSGIKARIACPPARRAAANPQRSVMAGTRLYMVCIRSRPRKYYATTDHSPFTRGSRMKTKTVAKPNMLIDYVNARPSLIRRRILWIYEDHKKDKRSGMEMIGWTPAPIYWGEETT